MSLWSWGEEKPKPIPIKKMSWVAHVLRQNDGTQIPELEVIQKILPVVLVPHKTDLRPLVEVKVKFDKKNWELFTPDGKPAKKGSNENEFVVFAFLNSQISELAFTIKGPDGENQTEVIYLFAPEVQEFQVVSPWNALSGSLGYTALTYQQTRFGVLALRGGVIGVDYITKEKSSRYGFMGHLDMTIFTFKSDPVPSNPQLVDGRLLLTYRLPYREHTRWRYKGLFGVGYLMMSSNGSPFGFSGLYYPDLALRAQHYLSTQSSFIYEFRFVPLEGVSLSDQRGLHASWTWSKTLKSLRRRDLSIKYSNTRFTSDGQFIGVELLGVSLGYSL